MDCPRTKNTDRNNGFKKQKKALYAKFEKKGYVGYYDKGTGCDTFVHKWEFYDFVDDSRPWE